MNDEQSEEWRAIRAEQEALRAQAECLEQRLKRFEATETPAPPLVPATPAVAPTPATDALQPPPIPPPPQTEATSRPPTFPEPPPVPPAPPVMPAVHAPIVSPKSLEMRVGSDLAVYAGVAVILAALAFLGDHLYRHVIQTAGPWVKTGVLYLGAGALAGVGLWLERSRQGKEHIDVRNYARVLIGGGLAAAYYVTYAAHAFPNLRIIASPLLDSVLLLGWTAVMVWMADWRGSQTMAALAVLLAFATSSLSGVAGFTLVSDIPLALGAVFLMQRHLWRALPFVCLLATYGSYVFWRLLYFGGYAFWEVVHFAGEQSGYFQAHGGQPLIGGGFWAEAAVLLLYWLLFTWAVLYTHEGALPTAERAVLAGLNNGMCFLLVGWLCLAHDPSLFWKWSVVFGFANLAMSEVCRRQRQERLHASEHTYLLEGVLFVTLGFLAYFTGWHLSLTLAVESVILMAASGRRHSPWLIGASVPAALLAFIFTLRDLIHIGGGDFRWLALVVIGLLAVNIWLSVRSPIASVAGAASAIFEMLTTALCIAWGEQYFPFRENFFFFVLAGAAAFILGIESRRDRLLFWSYFLTGAGLVAFFLFYDADDRRQLVQLLGILCLFAQRQFTRVRMMSFWSAAFFPAKFQVVLMSAAVLTGWWTWSAIIEHRPAGGLVPAASWPIYAALIFGFGLALSERVYRRWALFILAMAFGHIVFLDIWHLESLQRFYSLLCLGIVLLAIGYFYTRYQERLHDIF